MIVNPFAAARRTHNYMAQRGSRTASRPRRTTPAASPVQVTRLHPAITELLGTVDLRRVTILQVIDGLAVDVIVRNPVASRPSIGRAVHGRHVRPAA